MLWHETNKKLSAVFEQGSLPTMVYIYKQDTDEQRRTMKRPLHKHDSICEVLLIYRGEGTYLQENKLYKLTEGSVICCDQGKVHEMSTVGVEDFDCYCIGIANLRKKGLPVNTLLRKGQSCVRDSGELFRPSRICVIRSSNWRAAVWEAIWLHSFCVQL